MGYTIKQKIDICLKAEANPAMTQADLASWALEQYGSEKPPSQTTISRILSAKNDLVASKETEFQLVRRRKQSNPILRRILTEWITQAVWENIPVTTPIIQQTAHSIWNRLPLGEKDGQGLFSQRWCSQFMKKLNVNLAGDEEDVKGQANHYPLNKVWKLDEKIELKKHLVELVEKENYRPQDIFTIDEFQLFYSLPLDQIFDVSSIDKGLKQSSSSTEDSLTIMLGTNMDGSEKLMPLIIGKYDRFDVSKSTNSAFKNSAAVSSSKQSLMNKITETFNIFYKANVNKWITSSMFQNYLLTLDHKICSSTPDRKILVLLDDSSSHRIINLKFNCIRLCYLKNNTNLKNPYNSFNAVKVDYLPMNFGIVEEFKILYRIQHYLEIIGLQQKHCKENKAIATANNISTGADTNNYSRISSLAAEVLSETEYRVPLIKVIEWIQRSWESVSQEKIYLAWKKSHLFNLKKPWPASDADIARNSTKTFEQLGKTCLTYNPNKKYEKLSQIQQKLNVVIPWDIDDLLGLVNERGQMTLSYVSIEEIISSCLLEGHELIDCNKNDEVRQINFNDDLENEWMKDNFFASSNTFTTKSASPSILAMNKVSNEAIANEVFESTFSFDEVGGDSVKPMLLNTKVATSQTVPGDQANLVSSTDISMDESEQGLLSPVSKIVIEDFKSTSLVRSGPVSSGTLLGSNIPEKRRPEVPQEPGTNKRFLPSNYFASKEPSNSPCRQKNQRKSFNSGLTGSYSYNHHRNSEHEVMHLIQRLLELSNAGNTIHFTSSTIKELTLQLDNIKNKSQGLV